VEGKTTQSKDKGSNISLRKGNRSSQGMEKGSGGERRKETARNLTRKKAKFTRTKEWKLKKKV